MLSYKMSWLCFITLHCTVWNWD